MEVKYSKLIGSIVGIVLFIALVAGLTYAYYTWSSDKINVTDTSTCFNVDYVKGQNITSANLKLFDEKQVKKENNQITVYEGMAVTNVAAGIKSGCNIDGTLNIKLVVDKLSDSYTSTGDSKGALKYAVAEYSSSTDSNVSASSLKGKTFTVVASGSIDSKGTKTLHSVDLPKDNTKKEYLIIFYVDGPSSHNNSQNAEVSMKIEAEAVQKASAQDSAE